MGPRPLGYGVRWTLKSLPVFLNLLDLLKYYRANSMSVLIGWSKMCK